MTDDFLNKRLDERERDNALRSLRLPDGKADLCSNDYLGMVANGLIEDYLRSAETLAAPSPLSRFPRHGSTGSRLLAGNYPLIEATEKHLAAFHQAGSGLIFNSGYDANLGLMSAIAKRNDIVLYDQLSHASLRDGIRLSFARSFSFAHNDPADLEHRLQMHSGQSGSDMPDPPEPEPALPRSPGELFVVTESVFSMDGDRAPLGRIVDLCDRYGAHLIVDEAHATGVIGEKGEGLVQSLGLQEKCLARVHTFGKALGCHGAIVLGSTALRTYLINYARAFIFTTALPESSIYAIRAAYALFPKMTRERLRLRDLITRFQDAPIRYQRLPSQTPIQIVIVPGNDQVKEVARQLQDSGLDIRPILYPTVPKGSERLRIVLHSFNTPFQIERVMACLG